METAFDKLKNGGDMQRNSMRIRNKRVSSGARRDNALKKIFFRSKCKVVQGVESAWWARIHAESLSNNVYKVWQAQNDFEEAPQAAARSVERACSRVADRMLAERQKTQKQIVS